MSDISDADGYWLAGLTDGEGCFALWTRRRRVGRSDNCQCVTFVFKIAMRADDRAVLEAVQRILGGIGTFQINMRKSHKVGGYVYNGRPCGGKPLAQYTITNKEHLLSVVAFFRKYQLRSKKRKDFELWSEALDRFVHVTRTAQRTWKARTNRIQIRPQAGTPLLRFRRIPADLYSEMQRYEQLIKTGRIYQETECAA